MKSKLDPTIFYLLALFAVAVIAFSIFIPDIFWSVSNFQSMASQIPVLGILTLAMALPMLTGGINLSIIAGMNACSLIIAYFITQYTGIFLVIYCYFIKPLLCLSHWITQRHINCHYSCFTNFGNLRHNDFN